MKFTAAIFLAAAVAVQGGMNADGMRSKRIKIEQWEANREFAKEIRSTFPSTQSLARECNEITGQVIVQGTAFDCRNIDFEGFVNLDDMLINDLTNQGSDIWGWEDGNGREITLMCVNNGLWFIDSTNPENPRVIGSLPALSERGAPWCDVKVYKDVAYVVKDGSSPDNGIQVFDLKRLNNLPGVAPGDTSNYQVFSEDFLYTFHGDSHNVLIDNDSGFLYSVGANRGRNGGRGCRGGLHVVNLEPNPLQPRFETCISSDGYTHDAQCVVYDGPDERYTNREICFAYNEDTLTIWDVTNKRRPQMLARKPYQGSAYSHQGWLTADMKYVLLDDELDEESSRDKRTKTFMVNVQNLRNPVFEKVIIHDVNSIDHNLYFWGAVHEKGWGGGSNVQTPAILPQYAYLSNYASGIRVIELKEDLYIPKLAGYFDVSPEFNTAEFVGTWSNYMFTSGVLAVSSIERGLFLLRPKMAFSEVSAERMETASIRDIQQTVASEAEEDSASSTVVLGVLLGLALLAVPASAFIASKRTQRLMSRQQEEARALTVHEVEKTGPVASGKPVAHYEL